MLDRGQLGQKAATDGVLRFRSQFRQTAIRMAGGQQGELVMDCSAVRTIYHTQNSVYLRISHWHAANLEPLLLLLLNVRKFREIAMSCQFSSTKVFLLHVSYGFRIGYTDKFLLKPEKLYSSTCCQKKLMEAKTFHKLNQPSFLILP